MQNFSDIQYSTNDESKNTSNEITHDDIRDFDFAKNHCSNEFRSLAIIEFGGGYYNNIQYNLQEMSLFGGISTAKGYIYKIKDKLPNQDKGSGLILKTKINTDIDGWISVCTKEGIEKPYKFIDYFIMYFIAPSIVLCLLHEFISMIFNNCQYVYGVLLTLFAIISYFISKNKVNENTIQANREKEKERITDTVYINEKVSIKASDNIKDVNNIVTVEFIDILEKLKILFNNPKIYCKLSNDKVILAVHSYKKMFEMGGLFVPPTNPKIAEKFISQMAGILIFLDYVASLNDNSNL